MAGLLQQQQCPPHGHDFAAPMFNNKGHFSSPIGNFNSLPSNFSVSNGYGNNSRVPLNAVPYQTFDQPSLKQDWLMADPNMGPSKREFDCGSTDAGSCISDADSIQTAQAIDFGGFPSSSAPSDGGVVRRRPKPLTNRKFALRPASFPLETIPGTPVGKKRACYSDCGDDEVRACDELNLEPPSWEPTIGKKIPPAPPVEAPLCMPEPHLPAAPLRAADSTLMPPPPPVQPPRFNSQYEAQLCVPVPMPEAFAPTRGPATLPMAPAPRGPPAHSADETRTWSVGPIVFHQNSEISVRAEDIPLPAPLLLSPKLRAREAVMNKARQSAIPLKVRMLSLKGEMYTRESRVDPSMPVKKTITFGEFSEMTTSVSQSVQHGEPLKRRVTDFLLASPPCISAWAGAHP